MLEFFIALRGSYLVCSFCVVEVEYGLISINLTLVFVYLLLYCCLFGILLHVCC